MPTPCSSKANAELPTDIHAISQLIAGDMEGVDAVIRRRLQSDVVLINQLGNYIINSGGKRLRPQLVLLSARAFGYDGTDHITLANSVWGNEASVLVGDFLYSRAFEMMVEVRSMRIMEILAHATNTIAEGEVMQLLNCHDPDTAEDLYLEVIRSKTAKLFEAATQIALWNAPGNSFPADRRCARL